jgi:DNA mismatch repair protein MutS2
VLYPENIESKLGFDTIKEHLLKLCLSPLGERYVGNMSYVNQYDKLKPLLLQTAEFKEILTTGENFPGAYYLDVTPSLKKAKTVGSFLLEQELMDIKRSFETLIGCVNFLNTRGEDYPSLNVLSRGLSLNEGLPGQIGAVIDDTGVVRDNASKELATIRKEMHREQRQLRKTLESIFKSSKNSGYVPEGTSLTVRDGRMVIPLNAEHKRRVKGFIHAESSTGQTVFLEPAEVLEGNNKIRELEYAERREIVKLLTVLTNYIREQIEPLERAYRFLGVIDFVRAKARFAITLGAELPSLVNQPIINWENARHPLLFLAHQALNKPVVPLNISIDSTHKVLLISGPNAGGKSVCLKTVGLLQYMVQCGLLVPLNADSKVGVFKDIFIDIGDEQSIENDLSTYSSHLTNMKFVVKNSSEKSLVLIDEFGTGTEPQFGGAIAESILKELVGIGAFGVITTHYSNLKQFAERTEGVQNGAMRFDVQKLAPYYMLEIGKPGSSFALEIARKIGLSNTVIEHAKELLGREHTDMDKLLRDLERDKLRVNNRERSLKEKERSLKRELEKYEEVNTNITGKKKEILNQAKEEAAKLLSDTNREIEKTIRHIKENKAEKKETQQVRTKLAALKDKVKPEKVKKIDPELKVVGGVIVIGDHVRLIGQGVVGQVVGEKGKDLEVVIGELKSNIKRNRLEKVLHTAVKSLRKEKRKESLKGINLNQRNANFKSRIDVRGKRAEEILAIVEQFIDEAVMFGMMEVKILHGTGHGVLRDIIRQRLKEEPQVASFKDEHIEQGGSGITVVTFK